MFPAAVPIVRLAGDCSPSSLVFFWVPQMDGSAFKTNPIAPVKLSGIEDGTRSPHVYVLAIANAVAASLFLDAAGAYAVLGIPIPWLAVPVAFAASLMAWANCREVWLPQAMWPFLALLGWALVRAIQTWGTFPMPSGGTSSYGVFISLRFVEYCAFLAMAVSGYAIARLGVADRLSTLVLGLTAVVALYALYVYAAQLFGVWEPPRLRMGTAGQDFSQEAVEFTYAFHRALGSFREPSHMAQWLVPNLLMTWGCTHRSAPLLRALVVAALILSGSLLGVLALTAGLVALPVMTGGRNAVRSLGRIGLLSGVAVLVAQAVGVPVFDVISERVSGLFTGGVMATNRYYIADYVVSVSPPTLGFGWGNANLALSEYRGLELVSSHLSWYVSTYMALGVFGLVLLVLGFWIVGTSSVAVARAYPVHAGLGAAFFAWVVVFAGHAESPPIMFGLWAGLSLGLRDLMTVNVGVKDAVQ